MNKAHDVTIAILSYNHKCTIERCIQSVLNQKTTYTYKILLFDDASTDGTTEILKKYGDAFPEKIELFLYENNEGPIVRAKQMYENAKGRYLCWLDADDYWTYEYKLQTQIDFLEKNTEYVGCFHDAEIVSYVNNDENETAKKQSLKKYKYYSQFNHYEPDFYPFHLIMRNIIPTASLVFKNLDFNNFFNQYNLSIHSFSWAFQLYIIRNSKFYYFNQCWSIYYDHADGISKKLNSELFTINNIRVLNWYKNDKFYKTYKNKIYLSIAKEYEILAYNGKNIDTKFGFLMLLYYFKFWLLTTWYYVKNILEQKIKM
jgi:glycosyltransferase involved in cell wall biosynthesis